MHSDNIKDEINRLMNELDDYINDNTPNKDRLDVIKTKAILLNVLAINELNWSFYYTKEELKTLNRNIQMLR